VLRASARALAHRIVYFPDAQIGWYPGAVREGLRLLRRERFDVIYSSSFPITAHLVGGSVSRMANLPWIAEFRDPWSPRIERFPHRRRAERLERSIASRAERTVMPNDPMAEHFGGLWNTDIAVIPNGCEPVPFRPDAVVHPVIAHVGTYYPDRQSFAPVWRALAELRASGQPVPRIRWVGGTSSQIAAELAALGLGDLLDVSGTVTHRQALELMATSSILLASGDDDPGPLGRGTVAAKLFEYVASHRPIVYVGDAASDAARMLAAFPGCYVVGREDTARARHAIEAAFASPFRERDVESISARARARLLAQVLDAAHASVNSPCSSA